MKKNKLLITIALIGGAFLLYKVIKKRKRAFEWYDPKAYNL